MPQDNVKALVAAHEQFERSKGAQAKVAAAMTSFVMLAMAASVEAIILSTFVLVSQNRRQLLSDRRNELDLQISLVVEREITAILSMVRAMAKQLEVPIRHDPEELADLERVITPEEAMAHIDRHDPL